MRHRHIRPVVDGDIIHAGSVSLDVKRRFLLNSGRQLHLASRRFDVLSELIRSAGPISQEQLLKSIWGPDHDDCKTVQITVLRLRADLRDVPDIRIKTTAHAYELLIRG